MLRRVPVVLVLAAVGMLASACSAHDAATGRQGDIVFAQQMIPHHEQALEMSEIAQANASSPAVKRLARGISSGQEPEIVLMRQWLVDWGAAEVAHAPGPGEAPTESAADDHGHDMPGMASGEQLLALANASGEEFDRMWLELMVAHHEGAITMADQVLDTTEDLEVRALADAVRQAQSTEVERMQELLAR